MKKFIWLLILIILVVSIHWFRPAYCETIDTSGLAKIYYERQSSAGLSNRSTPYVSQEIYGEQPDVALPADSAGYVDNDPAAESGLSGLKPFGYDLFRTPHELSVPSDVADLSSYILGPGDNLVIHLWGKVENEYILTVDREGKIFLPKAGEIVVWGLTLDQCQERLHERLAEIYSDFKISLSLGKIRSIRIYLTGEVNKPGAYTVSSLTTLFNALYLAGGPNERGSMRDIRLIRDNQTVTILDLYRFLLQGDSRGDVRLSSGDAIFIPVTGPRVAVAGEVKRPAIYELKGGERVRQLLELAGGLTAEAYLDRLMLDRISPDDERQIIDLDLHSGQNPNKDNIELADGDRLTVYSVYEMKRNIVAIAGMVKHPGQFEWTDSTELASILKQAELLPDDVYYERANLFRRYADGRTEVIPINLNNIIGRRVNPSLEPMDSLHVYSVDDVERKKYVYVDGEVGRPGKYELYDKMTIADLIFLAGNLNKKAHQIDIEVARTDEFGKVSLVNLDFTSDEAQVFRLHDDDHVFVREIPDWFMHRMVTVEGEVMFPGKYILRSSNETLYDLLQRCGGFTSNAFAKGLILRRRSIGDQLTRQNLPEIIAGSQPLKEDSLGNIRRLELVRFNPEDLHRIIIDVEEIMASRGLKGNIQMQHNDYIFVPETPSGISVMGAVGANGTIKFTPNKKVKDYIKLAGSFTNQADKGSTKLIKADGQAFAGNGTLNKKVEIGDAIVVPTAIKKDRDWLKTVSGIVTIIGGAATTAFIVDRL